MYLKSLSILLTFLFLFQSISSKAQGDTKFGKVSKEELAMKVYPKDSSANAVILFDKGNAEIVYTNDGFKVVFERHCRVKIFNKEGYSWADVEIPYFAKGLEKVEEIDGFTYQMVNGEVVKYKLERSSILEEKINKEYQKKKFALPNVSEGAVIEYKYKSTSPYLVNFQSWTFQSTIPCIYSEYNASIFNYYNYKLLYRGEQEFEVNNEKKVLKSFHYSSYIYDVTTSKSNTVNGKSNASSGNTATGMVETEATNYQWIVRDVPAFKSEKYMTSEKDYISSVWFKLVSVKFPEDPGPRNVVSTWAEINTRLLESEDFGKDLKKTDYMKPLVSSVIGDESSAEKKIQLVYNYVKDHFKWDGEYGIFLNKPLKEVFESKTGDIVGINLILMNMLYYAGINSNPVIISTRENGQVLPLYPDVTQMDYVIVHVNIPDKGYLLLDASDPLVPSNLIPERCLNGQGWMVSPTSPGWVKLELNNKNNQSSYVSAQFDGEGRLTANIQISGNDYAALELRKAIGEYEEGKYFSKNFIQNGIIEEVPSEKIENLKEDLYKPLKATLEVKTNIVLEDITYLNPFLTNAIKENPFKLDERKYPVDFGYPFDLNYSITIKIPEGYQIEELPKSSIVTLPNNGGSYNYTIGKVENMIQLRTKISFKKAVFQPEEYPHLKEFYKQIISKQAEQIVLKKTQ